MSSGERKKRAISHGGKGWEEAGGEFYQESYPGADSDLEMMQNDPRRICTLLPSKKTRCGEEYIIFRMVFPIRFRLNSNMYYFLSSTIEYHWIF